MAPKSKKVLKEDPKAEKVLIDGKAPEQIRGKAGAADAKAAATMTKEEWCQLQTGMKENWPQPAYMSQRGAGSNHTCYMDETYQIVTRWSAETRIQYRPHAKAPGTKSHVRYEKYSKAETVGQSLEFGSFPADWCWDYERGFIKVLGPGRDEPLDPVTVEDEKELTDVDKAIYGWYVKELAKKLGVSVKELYENKNSGESAIMRAHRFQAQRLAKAALTKAKSEGRRVTDDEITQCLEAWGFARNSARTNVNPEGRDWVWSDNIGLTRDRLGSVHITKTTTKYPEFTEIVVKWLMDRLPEDCKDFRFTSLNLNKNYAAKLHRDGNNFGPSMIAAFGNFTGGDLNYWSEDDKQQKLGELPNVATEQFALGSGLALFNGNSAHSVEKFQGQRYSVVYFTASCHANLHPDDISILQNIGMPYPTHDVSQYSLLRAPRGYTTQGKLKSDNSNQLAARFWDRHALERPCFGQEPWTQEALKKWEERCSNLSQKSFVLRRPTNALKAEVKSNSMASTQTPEKKRACDNSQESTSKTAKKQRIAVAGA